MVKDGPVLERARTFDATPVASRHARYFVLEWLEAHGHPELADRIGLAVSELAANAVLHTTRPFTVGLDAKGGCVRVELVDSAPHRLASPVPTTGSAVDITSFSETGRGLQIVGALANRWGVVLDPNVKHVWAEFLAEAPERPSDPELEDRRPPAQPVADNVHRLCFLRLPVRAAIESGLDVENATRDIAWIPLDERSEEERALLELVEQSASLRLAGRHQAMHAASKNRLEFDLVVDAADDALAALGRLNEALNRRGTGRAPSPEVAVFRRWILDETQRQLDGGEPRPFGTGGSAVTEDSTAALLATANVGYVSVADGIVVAANATLAEFLGRTDLVGLRFDDLLAGNAKTSLDGDVTLAFATANGSSVTRGRATTENGVTRMVLNVPSQHVGELLHALQQTLIPPAPPSVPGLDVAAAYHPAQGEVGGDFYDVFEVAADDWCVVLGDVSGKGVDAAIVTSAARHAVRSAALREPVPSGLMHALNRALVAQNSTRFCTVALARLQRSADSWVATMTTGGHPFPLLLRHGAATKMGRPGSLLGVFDDVTFFDVSIKLAVGDALILFTDGIVEARDEHGELFGDERLHKAIQDAPPTAAGIVNAVLDEVLTYQAGKVADDIALVVIRRTEL